MPADVKLTRPEQIFDIRAEDLAQPLVVALRQVAGDRVDLDFRADRHCAGAQTAVDFFVGVYNRLERTPAHKGLHRDLGRHDADRVATLRDNWVNPDRILLPERLAQSRDRVHRNYRRIERVNAELRQAAGMRRPADEADALYQRAVRRVGKKGPRCDAARAGVYHHGQVDIVEMAFGNELGLSEHELDLAARDTGRALFNVDEFFGRHGEENDVAGELWRDSGFGQSDCRAQHAGDLGVVAAAVGRSGDRVGKGVLRGSQAVEFADEGEPGARRSAGESALDAGQRQTRSRCKPQSTHPLSNQSGGLYLVKAGLRVAEDRLAEIDYRVAVAVDGLAHRVLQLLFAAHLDPRRWLPFAVVF